MKLGNMMKRGGFFFEVLLYTLALYRWSHVREDVRRSIYSSTGAADSSPAGKKDRVCERERFACITQGGRINRFLPVGTYSSSPLKGFEFFDRQNCSGTRTGGEKRSGAAAKRAG